MWSFQDPTLLKSGSRRLFCAQLSAFPPAASHGPCTTRPQQAAQSTSPWTATFTGSSSAARLRTRSPGQRRRSTRRLVYRVRCCWRLSWFQCSLELLLIKLSSCFSPQIPAGVDVETQLTTLPCFANALHTDGKLIDDIYCAHAYVCLSTVYCFTPTRMLLPAFMTMHAGTAANLFVYLIKRQSRRIWIMNMVHVWILFTQDSNCL